jgi:preprotein translocase subunit SecY
MWLGEKITDKGIGNGISMLIMVGIIAGLPQSFAQEFASRVMESNGGMIMVLIELAIWFVIILASIMLVMAVRKIPVQYARRTASGSYEKNIFGARQFIPLKLNASGVMPIIFAQAIMFVPALIGGTSFGNGGFLQRTLGDPYGFSYNALLAVLIIVFTYFYTAIMINPRKIADELKRSGGFIPGVRPGEETADYIDSLVSRITFPGSVFLAMIAVLPAVAYIAGVNGQFAMFFGGTSLLIMVGVVLDTLQQIESYLLNRQMDGLMEGTRVKGRRTANELSGF